MIASRILLKDLYEIYYGPRWIVFSLFIPAIVVLLVGQLRTTTPSARILIGGLESCPDKSSYNSLNCLIDLVASEAEIFDATFEPDCVSSPENRIKSGEFDLVVNIREELGFWSIYVSETHPVRNFQYASLARALDSVFGELVRISRSDEAELSRYSGKGEILRVFKDSGLFSPDVALNYYDPSLSHSRVWLPMTVGLLVCFLPFLLSLSSVNKEREASTLEFLIGLPGYSSTGLVVGKSMLPAVISLLEFFAMLLLIHSLYGIYLKPGLVYFILLLVPAVFSSSLLGVTISCLASSQSHVVMSAGSYFLALFLLSGFLFPPDEASLPVQMLAFVFPLRFLIGPINDWMFGAGVGGGILVPIAALSLQTLVAAVVARQALVSAHRRW